MKKFRKSYPVGYIAAAIFFTIFSVMYLTLCNVVYTNGRQIYRHGYNEALAVYTLRTKTSAISSHVQELRVVAQANYNTNLQREKALQEVTERLEPQVNEDLEEMRAALQDLHNIPDLTEKDLQDINDIDAAVAEFEDAITTILQNGKEVYDSPAIEDNTPDAKRQQAALLKEKAEQNSKLMQNSQENLGIAIGKLFFLLTNDIANDQDCCHTYNVNE